MVTCRRFTFPELFIHRGLCISHHALARNYGRKTAVIATLLGVFGWGLSYFGCFQR
jgi:hypothetical protein